MTLLDRAIDLLCGAQSGFVSGSMPDVDWQNAKDKLLKDYRESRGVAQAALGPCTQAEIDAFEGLDSKSKQLFSMWVERALAAEEALALSSTHRPTAMTAQGALEIAANIADSFTCGICGMDGKAGAAIREVAKKGYWTQEDVAVSSTPRGDATRERLSPEDEAILFATGHLPEDF